MELNLHSIAYPVTSLGPGRRLALWVAGCNKRCKGCITPELLDPRAGKPIEVEKLIRHISRLKPVLDGISVSGGEPFEQPGPLAELLEGVLAYRPCWNVLVYSGYKLSEIQKRQGETAHFLRHIDVLIDGIYQQRLPSSHSLTGSGNQKVHYLTTQGSAMKPLVDALLPNTVNLGVGPSSHHLLIGVVKPDIRKSIHQVLGVRKAHSL